MEDVHTQYQFSFLLHISTSEYQGMLLSSQKHQFTCTGVSGLTSGENSGKCCFPHLGVFLGMPTSGMNAVLKLIQPAYGL